MGVDRFERPKHLRGKGKPWVDVAYRRVPWDGRLLLEVFVQLSRRNLRYRIVTALLGRVRTTELAPLGLTPCTVGQWLGEQMGKYVHDPKETDFVQLGEPTAEGLKFHKEHEAVSEFLTLTEHTGGAKRQTSMLLVLWEEGYFKVALQDRDAEKSLWVSALSIPEALAALEGHLRAGTGVWRNMGQGGSRPRKGGK